MMLCPWCLRCGACCGELEVTFGVVGRLWYHFQGPLNTLEVGALRLDRGSCSHPKYI